MKARLHTVYSSDVDVLSYTPEDPWNDGVWIRMVVGPTDGPGEESFDVLVCTPLWLRDVVAKDGPQIGRHHLIIEPFNLNEAIGFLRNKVESIQASDWAALGEVLGRIGYWEFEDYVT